MCGLAFALERSRGKEGSCVAPDASDKWHLGLSLQPRLTQRRREDRGWTEAAWREGRGDRDGRIQVGQRGTGGARWLEPFTAGDKVAGSNPPRTETLLWTRSIGGIKHDRSETVLERRNYDDTEGSGRACLSGVGSRSSAGRGYRRRAAWGGQSQG